MSTTKIHRTNLVSRFKCLGDRCEDTCCQRWTMVVNDRMVEHYIRHAPELMESIEPTDGSGWALRTDPDTQFCVRLEDGMCGIHKKFGEQLLGDACHFYPRVMRKLGERPYETATMSCPEIVRMALWGDDPFTWRETETERLPQKLIDYLPSGMTSEEGLDMHRAFIDEALSPRSVETNFLYIFGVAHALGRVPASSWAQAFPTYLKCAQSLLPPAEPNPADAFNIVYALCGLIVSSGKPCAPRLRQTIAEMEQALATTVNWETMESDITDASLAGLERARRLWKEEGAERYAPVLRRWLAMQMSHGLFPFSGLGGSIEERAVTLGVRLAMVKLALMCSYSISGPDLPQDVVVRVIQSLSRVLDHLASPSFSLKIYQETGWVRESRMRGLLERL